MDVAVRPGVKKPKKVLMIHEPVKNYLTGCLAGTKAQAAKWFIFCYAFPIHPAVEGAP